MTYFKSLHKLELRLIKLENKIDKFYDAVELLENHVIPREHVTLDHILQELKEIREEINGKIVSL